MIEWVIDLPLYCPIFHVGMVCNEIVENITVHSYYVVKLRDGNIGDTLGKMSCQVYAPLLITLIALKLALPVVSESVPALSI